MRILFFGVSPWIRTGYGKNAANICSRLKEHHQVAIFSYTNAEATLDWDGVPVFHRPPRVRQLPPVTRFVRNWFEEWNADLVLQHFDVWACGEELKNSGVPFLTYTPVDHSPLPPRIGQAIDAGNCVRVVAMSKFAEKQFEEAGFESTYIPHGVDILSSTSTASLIDNMEFMDGPRLAAISGTSMATPHQSGMLALIKQLYRENGVELTANMVKEIMERYGQPKTNDRGWGLLTWSIAKKYLEEVL